MIQISDLILAPAALSDKTADARLTALRAAISAGDYIAIEDALLPYAERIDQADKKIGSGAEIARISELMTLAQFGAASVGAVIARVCDDADAEPVAEALFVARFLVEVVLAAPGSPALLPSNLLKEHHVDRENVSWPDIEPVYRDLLVRASETIRRSDSLDIRISSPALRKLLARHRMETLRQINRLNKQDPQAAGARLTGLDRAMISLKLFLRLRGTS
jgi:hypothetical protein